MKSIHIPTLEKVAEGTWKIHETGFYTDGSGSFDWDHRIVYDTKELAIEKHREFLATSSNYVSMGIKEEEINGKVYYYGTYNVWD